MGDGGGGRRGERQALIQNMAKRLSMHGKLLLSEVPIYRVNTLRNCFCNPSPSPGPCCLPSWVSLRLRSPREVLLLQGPLQSPPSFVAKGRRRGGSESPGLLPSAGRLEVGQTRVLKAEGARAVSVEVCASVLARACKSAAGEVVAANVGAAGSPGPSARESCIDVSGRERSSLGSGVGQRPQWVRGSVGPWNLGSLEKRNEQEA